MLTEVLGRKRNGEGCRRDRRGPGGSHGLALTDAMAIRRCSLKLITLPLSVYSSTPGDS